MFPSVIMSSIASPEFVQSLHKNTIVSTVQISLSERYVWPDKQRGNTRIKFEPQLFNQTKKTYYRV